MRYHRLINGLAAQMEYLDDVFALRDNIFCAVPDELRVHPGNIPKQINDILLIGWCKLSSPSPSRCFRFVACCQVACICRFLRLNLSCFSRTHWTLVMQQLGRRNLNGDEPGWGIYNSNLIYIEYSMDAFFFLDFIVQFRTAYFARHGKHNNWVLVTDPTSIVIRYITTWFIIDALSGIPFEFANDMLAYTTNGKNPMRNDLQPHESLAWTRLIRICKVFQYSDRFRLTRLGRMDRHIQVNVCKLDSNRSAHTQNTPNPFGEFCL
jgi:hypothetical protein